MSAGNDGASNAMGSFKSLAAALGVLAIGLAFTAAAAKTRGCSASYRVEPVAGASFTMFDVSEARAERSAARANEARRRASGALIACMTDHLRQNGETAPSSCLRDGMRVYSLRRETPEKAAIRSLCCEAGPNYLGPVNFRITGRVYGDTGCPRITDAQLLHLGQRSCLNWRQSGACP